MVAIKGMEMPTDCKKCPLVGAKGKPTDPFSPMMCIALWATKHEIKHCVQGKILDDCPLVEIVTCKDCKYNNNGLCPDFRPHVNDNFYCADAKRRE